MSSLLLVTKNIATRSKKLLGTRASLLGARTLWSTCFSVERVLHATTHRPQQRSSVPSRRPRVSDEGITGHRQQTLSCTAFPLLEQGEGESKEKDMFIQNRLLLYIIYSMHIIVLLLKAIPT